MPASEGRRHRHHDPQAVGGGTAKARRATASGGEDGGARDAGRGSRPRPQQRPGSPRRLRGAPPGTDPRGEPAPAICDHILQSGLKGAAIIQDLLTLARRGVAISEVVRSTG